MIKSKRIWLFQMPILDEMKMTDRAAEIEVQQILAQGNNAQQNRVTFHPLRQIFAKFLPAAQRHGQGLGCNVVLLVVLWGRLAFGLEDFQRLDIFQNFQSSLDPLSFFGISQPPKSSGTSPLKLGILGKNIV